MKTLFSLICLSFCLVGCSESSDPPPANINIAEWTSYGGTEAGTRYSPLSQINKENVKKLKVAWTYRTGESPVGAAGYTMSECTPIAVEGKLYICTPLNQVMALDPETGKEIWRYNPLVPNHHYANGPTCRGVSTWRDKSKKSDELLARLIFIGTNDGRLISIDAKTGKPNPQFGEKGEVDLKKGIVEHGIGNYQVTSPPAIYNNLVIVGSSINDNEYQEESRGVVRAYDVLTGALKWSFDPIPRDPKDPAYETWVGTSAQTTGAANVWAVMSVDAERDLIFLPTSSPSADYYGGERIGENLWANSIVALKASTGEFVWGFQVVRHDIWDYDIPAQPTLVDVVVNEKTVPAVVQGTKMGNIFLLNRETGKPLYPIEERPVPQKGVAGEQPWHTQPFPTFPKPIVPQYLTVEDIWGVNEEEKKWAQDTFKKLHYEGIFTPGSEQGSLVFPGNIGGIAWGGLAVDPDEQMIIANTNRLGAIIKLSPRDIGEKEIPSSKVARVLQSTEKVEMYGTPYILFRSYFVSPKGIPCNPPPWGTLAAISLKDGKMKWEVPLGILEGVKDNPEAKKWGSLNYGGPLVTAGGLVFIAAAMDDHLRAFDRDTGEILWEIELPAGGQATPMTYQLSKNGRQFIVINAGGHGRLKTTPGDYFIAYTLNEE